MNEKDNRIIIAGYGGGGKDDGGQQHVPKEVTEGIITGNNLKDVSVAQIKILDLLSEGEIHGLSTGQYVYSGHLGNIGWTNVTFQPNAIATGNIRWLQSIFWNDTPVVDKTGNYNFQQIVVNTSRGSPNGSNISDDILDELTVTRLISERLYGGGENFAKIYRILDKDCIGTNVNIRISQMLEQIVTGENTGDIIDTTIVYSIYYRPLFSNRTINTFTLGKKETLTGKITQGYIQSTRINFNVSYSSDETFLGWEIKIVRTTEDSTTSKVRNQTFIDSLTEIYGSKFIYPNSAIVSSLFDAKYFSNIPARTYLNQGIKVKIPSNYNPIYKTYDESSPWEGTFKEDDQSRILKTWTDNPAWCYYDLLTNKRYGLGNYVDEDFIDKFSLYEIGKYCDTLVSDGYGGLEPRFTCNVYITSQDEAYKVVNAMASIFRGITYYSAGQIYTVQDSQKSPIYQFTNANVVEGDFTYSSSAKKARHTIAVVRYNDKNNFYKPALEYVEDIDAIRKYGLRDVEVPAYGCTSRGQAIRLGRWALLTESLETESINFRAGLDIAGFLRPGDVFQIYDSNRKAQRLGGRLHNIIVTGNYSNLTLDSEITGLASGTTYKFSLLTPTFYYDPSQVTEDLNSSGFASGFRRSNIQYLTFNITNATTISGRTNLNINQALDYTNYDVSGNYIWMVEATGSTISGNISLNEWDTYRVINIKENDTHIYEVDGLQYELGKFLQIESGFSFTDSVFAPGGELTFASPTNLSLNLQNPPPSPSSQQINYGFIISDTTNIRSYRVLVKNSAFITNDEYNPNYIIAELPVNTLSGSYLPPENGTYYFRAYSIGENDSLSSSFASSSIGVSNINILQDITISSLRLYDGTLTNNAAGTLSSGIYATSSPKFTWQVGLGDSTIVPDDLFYRITIREPSNNNQPNPEIYFQESGYRANNPTYTFNFNNNYNAISTPSHIHGPFRNYDVVVEAAASGGFSSAGGTFTPNGDVNNYTDANGYDILYANNPRPNTVCLYTGSASSSFYTTGKATQQWITQDGEIKIFLTSSGNATTFNQFFDDDIAGVTLHYSTLPFSRTDLLPPTPRSDINSVQITSTSNPIIYPANLVNIEREYIAIAPYDDFDVGISNKISNYLTTGLNFCDPVFITQKELVASVSNTYKAWGEISAGDFSSTIIIASYNIAQITKSNTTYTLTFTTPLTTDSYAINYSLISEPSNHRNNTFFNIVSRDRTKIVFTLTFVTSTFSPSSFFIGVLTN